MESFSRRVAGIVQQIGTRPVWLFLLLAVWLFASSGLRPLFVPDEGRYVGVATEMLQDHDWLTPRLDGLPFFHKPPLFYWITAASLKVFGHHEWAARVAPFLGAWFALLAVFWFLDRHANRRTATLGVLILASTPMIFAGAQFASMDMLVGALIAITILLLAHVSQEFEAGRTAPGWLILAYVTSALGVLTKGLIGLVLPGMVLFFWLLIERRYRHLYRLISLPGLAAFLVITVPWFWLMEQAHPGFLYYTFVYQQFDRYLEHGFNNPQPFYFYLEILLGGLLPWSFLTLYLFRRPRRNGLWASSTIRLAWVWIGAILLFFSIPTSKLIGYILPTVPAFALVLAPFLDRHWSTPRWPGRAALMAGGGAALGLAAAITFSLIDHKSLKDLASQLRERIAPTDRVLFVGYYFYSAPYYLGDVWPVMIAGPWNDTKAVSGDSSSSEFYTSSQFDPDAARRILIPYDRLRAVACGPSVVWAFMRDEDRKRFPVITAFPQVLHSRRDKVGIYRLGGTERPETAQEVCAHGDQPEHERQGQ